MCKLIFVLVVIMCITKEVITAPQYDNYYYPSPVYRQPSFELEPPDTGYVVRAERQLDVAAAPTYAYDANYYNTQQQYYPQQEP